MRIEEIGTSEAMMLYLVSLAGTTELALLERLGLIECDDSLEEARWLRLVILGMAKRVIEVWNR